MWATRSKVVCRGSGQRIPLPVQVLGLLYGRGDAHFTVPSIAEGSILHGTFLNSGLV